MVVSVVVVPHVMGVAAAHVVVPDVVVPDVVAPEVAGVTAAHVVVPDVAGVAVADRE